MDFREIAPSQAQNFVNCTSVEQNPEPDSAVDAEWFEWQRKPDNARLRLRGWRFGRTSAASQQWNMA